MGYEDFNDEKFENALQSFGKALERDKDNPEVNGMIINCYLELGRMEEAKSHLTNLSDKLSNTPDIMKVAARIDILVKSEGLEDIETLRNGVKENPNDLKSKFDLANALNASSFSEEAIQILIEIYKEDRFF